MGKAYRKSTKIWSFFMVVSFLALGCLGGKIINSLYVQRVCVVGESMENTYYDGDTLLMRVGKTPKRNDIVVAWTQGREIIKRVVALPGEKVQIREGICTFSRGRVFSGESEGVRGRNSQRRYQAG